MKRNLMLLTMLLAIVSGTAEERYQTIGWDKNWITYDCHNEMRRTSYVLYDGERVIANITATCLTAPSMGQSPSTPYYNLQGRPVANLTRGIYIKDGRKMIFNSEF